MSRYIDADVIRDEWLHGGENEHIYDTNDFLNSIDDQPTADVEPVRHAHWIVYADIPVVWCSGCESLIFADKERLNDKVHYCPHCGAKMDESVTE